MADNARTDFAFLGLKGSMVTACLKDGTLLEGIFDVFHHKTRHISLKLVLEYDASNQDEPKEMDVREFALNELHYLTTEPINFAEVTSGGSLGFATDTEISGKDSFGKLKERELARWDGGNTAMSTGEGPCELFGKLEDGPPGTGWDQFDANRRLFGIETSFDESQYTTIIDRTSEEYRCLEQEAERLASEITKGTSSASGNVHMAEERGVIFDDSQIDEEDRYGAVVRSDRKADEKSLQPVRSPKIPPASFREAALSSISTVPVVTMPSKVTSKPSSTFPALATAAEVSSSSPTEGKPRKSIANLNVDPAQLEQARELVHATTSQSDQKFKQKENFIV